MWFRERQSSGRRSPARPFALIVVAALAKFADDSLVKRLQYRFMEASGVGTF